MNAQTAKPTPSFLLAQAHVLFKQTGLTPYQLADQRAELLGALQAILPWIPKSSAKDGGASAFSENVRAADKVRAAIQRATGEHP